MKSKLEQLYEDQTIICEGLNLLKFYNDFYGNCKLLTKEQLERLFKLSELETKKLAILEIVLEKELENE